MRLVEIDDYLALCLVGGFVAFLALGIVGHSCRRPPEPTPTPINLRFAQSIDCRLVSHWRLMYADAGAPAPTGMVGSTAARPGECDRKTIRRRMRFWGAGPTRFWLRACGEHGCGGLSKPIDKNMPPRAALDVVITEEN